MPSASTLNAREQRRVVAGTTIGTAIEWYDYFLYAAVAGLVFKQVMFSPEMSPGLATIVSFASVGISFLFRPLGAFLAGYCADRFGRRAVLVATLLTMGIATVIIGVLPTYATAGAAAPIMLIILRILQGISAGGEWGAAALLSVEHAPAGKRGLYGSGPQLGAPLGLLLSSVVLALVSAFTTEETFMSYGWRIPFLLSAVLIVVGLFIRHSVEESPVYSTMVERPDTAPATNPMGTLLRRFPLVVLIASLVLAANTASGYMTTGGFIQSYATSSAGLDRGVVLSAVAASAVGWSLSTVAAGVISDRIGRKNTFIVGFIVQLLGNLALFPLVNTGNAAAFTAGLVIMSLGIGLTYGQIAAYYAELYPAPVRASGASITYALASILGGAFAPTIAAALTQSTGGTAAVTAYLVAMTLIGLVATLCLRDRTNVDLSPDAAQDRSILAWHH
ncbi:MFS transporter [Corynebacterium tapiri]|uniref:MHS family MFS transporter n=1 Tax=Corynebacterium tapiri TaxID=1448266 RepID=A0A5C4U3N2_9CORY|nr:MFS transporter [Corynebacterium tapiri]TNL96662.1 MHS family MFS transporter [Corynebacterium tapiri]